MWQIHFYEDPRGQSPVLEFIDSLSPKDRAKANNTFRLLEEFGMNLGMPPTRRIEGRLWELRPGDDRLFYCLYLDQQFVILPGFRKHSMKTPEKEIATALRRLKEITEQ